MCNTYGITPGTADYTNDPFVITGNCSVGGEVNKTVGDFVTRLYRTCLDRDPDTSGLNYWVGLAVSGARNGRTLAEGFVYSNEFKGKNYDNDSYIEHLYQAFFGRSSDASGKAYWMSQLNSGKTRDFVFNGFVGSLEFTRLCNQYGIIRG